MIMDELVDLNKERLAALDVLIRKIERVSKVYNKKVKVKTFLTGDCVWKVIFPMNQKDKNLEKWSPHWEGQFRVIQVFSNNA